MLAGVSRGSALDGRGVQASVRLACAFFRQLPLKNGRHLSCRLPQSVRKQTLPQRDGFQRRLILEARETGVKDATGAREEQVFKNLLVKFI